MLIEQQKVPESFVKTLVTEDLNSRLATMQEQILSRSRLQPIVEKFNLYATKGMGMDARIDSVRKDIGIRPIESQIARTGGLPGFFISFKASDAHTAQMVCSEITSLFISASLSDQEKSAAIKSLTMLAQQLETSFEPDRSSFDRVIEQERRDSYKYGGRTVFGKAKPPKGGQLNLF